MPKRRRGSRRRNSATNLGVQRAATSILPPLHQAVLLPTGQKMPRQRDGAPAELDRLSSEHQTCLQCASPLPFEILHRPLVCFRLLARDEGSQVPALAGLGVLLSRIQPVLSRLQLANHQLLLPQLMRWIHARGLGMACPSQFGTSRRSFLSPEKEFTWPLLLPLHKLF